MDYTPSHLGQVSNDPIGELDLIPWRGADIAVTLNCSEFNSNCPVTKQPDFANLVIEYVPNDHLIETKSLKLFLRSYKEVLAFNESVIDDLATRINNQLKPKSLVITGEFHIRGGIAVTVTAERWNLK
jgi:7-cyano-7-deazaguanine reductase